MKVGCSAEHSAFEVGLESANKIGRWLISAMVRSTSAMVDRFLCRQVSRSLSYSRARKPPQELMREHRKRIVAGSHDHDAVATTGQLAITASVTIWKGKGFSTAPFDLANDFSAANAAVDRAAEIYGLGHNQNVISVQPVGKAVHEGVLHQAHRAVAVRLKHQQQAAGKRVHGFERGRYLVGVVGKIVDHRY